MQAIYKRDRSIFQGSDTKFCCPSHDGLRKDHKKAANRRFRHTNKTISRQQPYARGIATLERVQDTV